MRPSFLLPALVLALAAAPRAGNWEAALEAMGHGSRADNGDRSAFLAAAGWKGEAASLQAQIARVRRFEAWGTRFGMDAYARTWRAAYANLWAQSSPDAEFLPRLDWRAEIFQGLPRGFEVSGSFRLMRFRKDRVDLAGLGAARYLGTWYLRLSGGASPSGGPPWTASFAARRFLGEAGDYAEVRAGLGLVDATCAECAGERGFGDGYLSIRARKSLSTRAGLTLGLQAGHEEGLGAFGEAAGGLFLRW